MVLLLACNLIYLRVLYKLFIFVLRWNLVYTEIQPLLWWYLYSLCYPHSLCICPVDALNKIYCYSQVFPSYLISHFKVNMTERLYQDEYMIIIIIFPRPRQDHSVTVPAWEGGVYYKGSF